MSEDLQNHRQEIDRIAASTQFNGRKLLAGEGEARARGVREAIAVVLVDVGRDAMARRERCHRPHVVDVPVGDQDAAQSLEANTRL